MSRPSGPRIESPREIADLPPGTQVVVGGRILTVRDLGAIAFWVLAWDGAQVQVVASGERQVRRSDVVEILGTVAGRDGGVELVLNEVLSHHVARDRQTAVDMHLFDDSFLPALRLRAAVESAVREILERSDYMAVRSPGVVGDWVQGQTGAFEVDYYGRSAYLSISNMLAHQLLLGSGLSRIYEIGPIYRAENPPNRRRLAEFTMVDLGRSFARLDDLLADVERVMAVAARTTREHGAGDTLTCESPFPRISWYDVVRDSGVGSTSGAQLPAKARSFLQETFPGFVWVTGFPERTRPFFVRAADGVCVDAQLWFRGVIYLAAGGERETDVDEIVRRIEQEGKQPDCYDFFLRYARRSLPSAVGMGFGLERLLATITGSPASRFSAFPGPIGNLPRRSDRP